MASEVAALVSEMNDTLADIRQTIDALSTTTHTSRLDQLEHQRDSTIAALRANFERETDDLVVKRRRERDEIMERRRQEDEEIAAKRRREDEDMNERDEREDEDRERRFVSETDDVEDEMDSLMEGVETEAEDFLAQGRDKLTQLEERRRELNRLIDEQVRVPFPTITTRRRSRSQRMMDAAITSKPAPTQAMGEPVNNSLKAIKEERNGDAVEAPPQQAGRGPPTIQGEDDARAISRSEDTSRGSFESAGLRRSRTASVSSSQRGSRMSAFGWIAGKIGLSETREEAEASQEPTLETFVPTVGETDSASVLEETHTENLPTSESVVNGEVQVATISPARALVNEPGGPIGEKESNELASAQREIRDPSPDYQESSQESQFAPVSMVATNQPTDNIQNELEFDHSQLHQSNAVYNEEMNGVKLSHGQSAAPSRAESPVEIGTGLDGSETTLEVDSEPYQEGESIQKTEEKDGDGDFDPEKEALDILDGESDAVILDMTSDSVEDWSQMPVVPIGTDDTNPEGSSLSPGLDQKQSPPHTHDNGATVLGVDSKDARDDLGVNVEEAARTSPAQRELEEIQNARHILSAPVALDGEHPSESLESPVYEYTEQSHAFDHGASDMPSLEQGYEDNVTTSDTSNETMQQMEDAPESQYPASAEVIETTFEPTTDDAPQNLALTLGQDSEAPEALNEFSQIELPPHAMDYDLGSDTLQLPNGTWPVGVVDENFLESLIAQFLVSTPSISERNLGENDRLGPHSPGERDLGAPSLEDQSNNVTPCPGDQNYEAEPVSLAYPSFAHEVKPVAMQLSNGVWSIDPDDGDFEDVPGLSQMSQNAAASEAYPSMIDAPKKGQAHTREEVFVQGTAFDVQSVTMQLPSGAWVLNHSEDEHEIPSTHTQQTSPPTDQIPPTTDAPGPPAANFHHEIPPEVTQLPSPAGLDGSSLAANPGEMLKDLNKEQAPPALESSPGNRNETAEIPSEQVISDNHGKHLRYNASQAASREGTNLPWSPFNSRIPLSPEASPETAVQSPELAEAYETTPDESANTTNLAGRHSTFGYGSNQAGPEQTEYPIHNAPDNPYVYADMLNVTEAENDSDSQNFVTPLQSTGMQSPQAFQDPPDTFHNAVDYFHGEAPHEETAMTVHGQDELFDSDSMSEYEPDPGVDENGDPRANLGMPPQYHVFANGHSDEATDSPNTAILQPSGEQPSQHTPEMPPAVEDNSDVSPMSLRGSSPPPEHPRRGLAFSRHNPERPVTPAAQIIPDDLSSHKGTWAASGPIDSTPMSLVSHSTLSSSPDSPIRERVQECHEPAIQNSWSERLHRYQYGHHDYEREYEATPAQEGKIDENLPTPIATHMPESVRDYSPATPSPSTLIQKMRSIFENPTESSTVRSRPSSGIYHPPRPLESPGYDVPGESRKGGFLNEAEDEVDERSALLGGVGGD